MIFNIIFNFNKLLLNFIIYFINFRIIIRLCNIHIFSNFSVKRTNQEWLEIVSKQRSLYTEDIGRWREKLTLTLQQLDSARETVLVLSNRVKHIADTLNLRSNNEFDSSNTHSQPVDTNPTWSCYSNSVNHNISSNNLTSLKA